MCIYICCIHKYVMDGWMDLCRYASLCIYPYMFVRTYIDVHAYMHVYAEGHALEKGYADGWVDRRINQARYRSIEIDG